MSLGMRTRSTAIGVKGILHQRDGCPEDLAQVQSERRGKCIRPCSYILLCQPLQKLTDEFCSLSTRESHPTRVVSPVQFSLSQDSAVQHDRCMSQSRPLRISMNVRRHAAHERKEQDHDRQDVAADTADDCIPVLYASYRRCRSGPCTR